MVVILVLITLVISITVEIIRSRRKWVSDHQHQSKTPTPAAIRGAECFLHPGHSWARVINPRQALLGVDELPPSFVGRVDVVSMPETGKRVRQGGPLVTLKSGRRTITVVSPLSGIIRSVNSRLGLDPMLVNRSPLDQGWVAQIEPEDLEVESRNLLCGVQAIRWKEAVLAQFQNLFSKRLGTVLPDGGSLVSDLGETLEDEVWESLAQELFPLHTSDQTETKSIQGMKP